MKEIRLKPVSEPVREAQALEKYLLGILKQYFYAPLVSITGLNTIHNAANVLPALHKAIEDGDIRYEGSGFSGKFNAAVSKELKDLGAKWNSGKWEIPTELLSPALQRSIHTQMVKDEAFKKQFGEVIIQIKPEEIASKVKPKRFLDSTVKTVNEEVTKSFKVAAEHLVVSPVISDEAKEKIKSDYLENLKLSIKDFTEEQILSLRKQVEQHVFSGNRRDQLARIISQSFSVSKRKANFLAGQETRLLTSKLAQTRYADVGVDDYEWRTVTGTAAHPVRHFHRILDRTKQKFSKPPITNKQGNHNNPGEDYNCRCSAIPILKIT